MEIKNKEKKIVIIGLMVALLILIIFVVNAYVQSNEETYEKVTLEYSGYEQEWYLSSPLPSPVVLPLVSPSSKSTPSPKPAFTPTPSPFFEPVKALYLNSYVVKNKLEHYIKLANKTEINAYVIDIKNEHGKVQYKSKIPEVVAAKAYTEGYDVKKVIKKFHENNIRVIGRIVAFLDGIYPKYNPNVAIKKKSGKLLTYGRGLAFLDATNRKSWEYIFKIAQEALKFGFDEIQFDYIRFPETTIYNYVLQGLEAGKKRSYYIESFIEYVRKNLPKGTILSADIFGMPMISEKDWGQIGQSLETIGQNLDYISPMIYPSHYANNAPKGFSMANGVGQTINGVKFTHPDLDPYGVVYNTLCAGKKRIESIDRYNLKVRPYLQGFTASFLPKGYWQHYSAVQYREQIQAVYDAGYESWIFWNVGGNYVEEAFLPEKDLD